MKSISFLILTLSLASASFAASDGVAHHPAPKDPKYISISSYDSLKSRIPASPKPDSAEQKSDETEILRLQKNRTSAQCEMAQSEVYVSLASFYKKQLPELKEAQFKKVSDFFETVRNEGDFFIQKLKKDFPRPRPFAYMKSITPCVPKEVSLAYPSGHAALSQLYALLLADLFPEKKEVLMARAVEIGQHRILSGMHHPSDVKSGRLLGELIYENLKSSKKFLADSSELKASLGN